MLPSLPRHTALFPCTPACTQLPGSPAPVAMTLKTHGVLATFHLLQSRAQYYHSETPCCTSLCHIQSIPSVAVGTCVFLVYSKGQNAEQKRFAGCECRSALGMGIAVGREGKEARMWEGKEKRDRTRDVWTLDGFDLILHFPCTWCQLTKLFFPKLLTLDS